MTAQPRFLIGIDPGTKTGITLYDRREKRIIETRTTTILAAMAFVKAFISVHTADDVEVRIEDPNTWVGFKGTDPKAARARAQGAGSIKRDFAIWQEFFAMHGIDYTPVKLQGKLKKLNRETFVRLTDYHGSTDSHGRDAAMLVFGG